MVRNFVTDKSITLFWEPDWERREKVIYRILVNGEVVGETAKTHYTIKNLEANCEYGIVCGSVIHE